MMAAALVLLAASASPASAGFRYVPPEVEAAAEPAAKGSDAGAEDIEPGPAPGREVSGTSVSGRRVSDTSTWWVRAGEMLRDVLGRWGARAGKNVVFLTDRRYRLNGDAAFEGGFAQATRVLFEALGHLPHPPEGMFSADGTTLAVTHRQAGPTGTGGKP